MKAVFGRSSKKTNPSVDLRQPEYQSSSSAPSGRTPKQDQGPLFDSPEFTGYTRQPARAASQRQSTISTSTAGSNPLYGQINRSEDKLAAHRSSQYLNPQGSTEFIQEEKHKKGFREKLGLGQSSRQSVEQRGEGSSRASSVNRASSISKKSSVDSGRLVQGQQGDLRGPTWSTAGSDPRLIAHAEEDENPQYEAYQTQQHAYPEPGQQQALDNAPRDNYYSPDSLGHHQYPVPGQQQGAPPGYYTQQPTLHRIDTDQSNQSHYTDPDHHPDPLLSPLPPQTTYQQENPHYYQQQGVAYQPQDPYQRGYQHHPDTLSSPIQQRHPDHFVGQGHPQAYLPVDQGRSASRASSSQFDGSSVQGSRASFEHPGQYRDQDDVVYIGTAQTAHQQTSSKQENIYLQPPGANASQIHPPPSPLHGAREQQPVSVSPQPPSPAEEAITPMPREVQARASNSVRQSEGRSGNRESSSFPQQGVPATPGFAGPTHSTSRAQKGDDKGRETPVPAGDMTDEQVAHYQQLLKDHKELKEKYQKVKKYYFEKESQVHNLQNTLAHQRLSQSRTSLDDSEYSARFGRLDGLISQLAFGIRKSWKSIPDFLQRAVNKDAIAIGKQEMTVVGRAYISNWLVSEVFNEYFHPDLDLQLNQQLKAIFSNIRAACPPFQSKEEEEALNSKLINWRMTTLEGLQHQLHSAAAPQNRAALMDLLKDKLISNLSDLLVEPTPPELTTGVPMIIELAINIAIHLPIESRDVVIEYYHPGDAILQNVMKIESGIPALTNPIAPLDLDAERASLKSAAGSSAADNGASDENGKDDGARGSVKKSGILSGIMGGGSNAGTLKKAAPPSAQMAAAKGSPAEGPASASSAGKEERVRLAAGVSVQIRGRSVLMKAPVYAL